MNNEIEEVLGELIGVVSVEFMSHPDGKKIVMPVESLMEYQKLAYSKLEAIVAKARQDGFRAGVTIRIGDSDEMRKVYETGYNTGYVAKRRSRLAEGGIDK